jgi:hypothetical protein
MQRRLLVLVASLSILGIVAFTVSPASAMKRDEFSGKATGSVHCSIMVKVKYGPRMNNRRGDTSKHFLVRLSNCVSHGPSGQTISGGTIKDKGLAAGAAFTHSVLNCNHPAASAMTLTISWKGRFTGNVGSQHFSGKASFTNSPVEFSGETAVTNPQGLAGVSLPGSGGSASVSNVSSFPHAAPNGASATLYTAYKPSQLSAMCAGSGIGKLIYTGTITVN